jgi:hypothetical protein
MNTNQIKELMYKSLSDQDIRAFLPNVRIMPYQELRAYKTIEQILPRQFDYLVLHVAVNRPQSGHWCCLVRSGKNIFFFDSYAYRPDKQLLFSKKQYRRVLGQKFPFLSYILNNAVDNGYHVMFNNFKYQSENPDITTCGYWCIAFIKYMISAKPKDRSFVGFNKYIEYMSDRYQMKDLDYLVVAMLRN